MQRDILINQQQTFKAITGFRFALKRLQILSTVIFQIFRETHSFREFKMAVRHILQFSRNNLGNTPQHRYIKHNGQYFWSMYSAPWPSIQLKEEIKREIRYGLDPKNAADPLHLIFLSITKKCPLNCEHCFEWNIMHKPERLSVQEMLDIIHKFKLRGLSSLYLTGGEPLSRFSDLLEIIEESSKDLNLWLFTSGYGMNAEKATAIKKAGARGILISLDHFDESKHNAFRGNEQSFKHALRAAKTAKEAGLITALSLCVTKEFNSIENLDSYMELAKELSVAFVQFLDARQKGKYASKDVGLSAEEINHLIDYYRTFNGNRNNRHYPTIIYSGYFQRNFGCNAGGHRYLYVDSDANIQSCPFCEIPLGNALNEPLQYRKGSCAIAKIASA